MHLFHIPQSTVENRHLHISVQNGLLWKMGQVHFEICETGLFALVVTSADMITYTNSNSANRVRHHINTKKAWWRHQMEIFSALLALCEGNPPVDSPSKGQWRGAIVFSLICTWTNDWPNNGDAGDLRRHRAHYDITVMKMHSTRNQNIKCWKSFRKAL